MRQRQPKTTASGLPPFWRTLVTRALASGTPTPFHLCSLEPIKSALAELATLDAGLPLRHWLSCKTQPVRPLLQWWQRQNGTIEVVSEFELLAAQACGFPPGRILVNGPAKHHWLPRHRVRGLGVNFDSLTEAKALLPQAVALGWRVGLRLLTQQEFDPERPEFPTQFGMEREEAIKAVKLLQCARARLEVVHFHLRTNVASPAIYERALDEVAGICRTARFAPKYVDCGGGLPPPDVVSLAGQAYNRDFRLADLAAVYRRAAPQFPGLREFWLENGRFLSARSGVLVLRVLEIKERRGLRQLICDGGRTLQALISTWEAHRLFPVPRRTGPTCLTAVCGPTCMAFDQITRRELPRSLRPGDHLVWLDSGAYHIPWETRFSHGLGAVLWHENHRLQIVRHPETFDTWWNQWQPAR